MSEADTPTVKTKKSKMVPVPGREQAEKNYVENYPDGTFIWLDPKDYKPLTKKTKRKIHELRAAEYKERPEVFKNKLGEHAEECIKTITRYANKQNKSAQDDTSAEHAGSDESGQGTGKQMRNPFVV